MKRKPYTVQEKEILLQSEAIVKVTNSNATFSNFRSIILNFICRQIELLLYK